MRTLLISLSAAAAAVAVAVASPAAAQYYPAQPYGYGQGYGFNGYNNYGQVRALQQRIDRLEYQVRMLDRRDFIPDGRADRLREEAQRIEGRLHRAQRNGLNPYEAQEIQRRIARLESQVQYASAARYGGYNDYRDRGYYNHDGDRHDRDRDDDD